jgi:hypothetical protein
MPLSVPPRVAESAAIACVANSAASTAKAKEAIKPRFTLVLLSCLDYPTGGAQ